jgi:hypothetical protein
MRADDVPIQFVGAEGGFVTGWRWIETPSPLALALVWLHAENAEGRACRVNQLAVLCAAAGAYRLRAANVTSDYSLPPFPIPLGEREPPPPTVGRGRLGVEILTTYTLPGAGSITLVANQPHNTRGSGSSRGYPGSTSLTLHADLVVALEPCGAVTEGVHNAFGLRERNDHRHAVGFTLALVTIVTPSSDEMLGSNW